MHTIMTNGDRSESNGNGHASTDFTSFFSSEIFQLVLHNPTTAHRFLVFCRNHACGENIEFLQKVDRYHSLLADVKGLIGDIRTNYISADAPDQVNLSYQVMDQADSDVDSALHDVIPGLEKVFDKAQSQVEKLLSNDIYHRWVRHQLTMSAALALGENKSRYRGLGDCFCLTDPGKPDNPIVYASDGFIGVTGYERRDIIPRNCRFLQGPLTDKRCSQRMRTAIFEQVESVELILNYRKNGEPFWNLLYIAPLYDDRGNLAFFLGGQIDCSTTIHSNTDVVRILSLNDEAVLERTKTPQERGTQSAKRGSIFTRHSRKSSTQVSEATMQVGMEEVLVEKIGKMSFQTQVEAFYTAYSKYFVLKYSSVTAAMTISHYSSGIIDMLCLPRSEEHLAALFREDIFKILSDISPSISKSFRSIVKDNVNQGKAVSLELGLLTGIERKSSQENKRIVENYASHWTPVKDEVGKTAYVILVISPR